MKDLMLFPFFVVLLDSFVLMAHNFYLWFTTGKPAFLEVQAIQQYNIQYRHFAWKKELLLSRT